MRFGKEAEFGAGFFLATDIHIGSRVLAHAHEGDARRGPSCGDERLQHGGGVIYVARPRSGEAEAAIVALAALQPGGRGADRCGALRVAGGSQRQQPEGRQIHEATEGSVAAAQAPAKAYNPLFLWGGVGLGKTHLMHAIGNHVISENPRANVVYVSTEKFTNEFIIAIKNNETLQFRNKYRHADVLLIADIQFLEGKEQTQEEFFHTFNSLYESSRQLVISSDRAPTELQTLEHRLRSRFGGGLTIDVQTPDVETREAILRKKAESESVHVPDEVTSLIAKLVPSNIRELEGALIRVVAFASLTKCPVTSELAIEALKNVIPVAPVRRVTIAHIKDVVAKAHALTVKEMDNHRRDQRLAAPRQIAMYVSTVLTDNSLPQIAREFNKKDHTTVMYARDKVKELMERDEAYRSKVEQLIASCQHG